MQTTPETEALLHELYNRSLIVEELDGPQVEAWVSGLFPLFDDQVTPGGFVDYCLRQNSDAGHLLALAVAELLTGLDDASAVESVQLTMQDVGRDVSGIAEQIGTSVLTAAWMVDAPFGRSIVLGFENPVVVMDPDEEDAPDTRHSILVEVSRSGSLEDLQLTGPPQALLDEAVAVDHRVRVREMSVDDAVDLIIEVWPKAGAPTSEAGPGVGANQQFVRRRLRQVSKSTLPTILDSEKIVDIRRGLDDEEYARANNAALSTLQAAVGGLPAEQAELAEPETVAIWAGLIRGDGGDLASRERDALLWLEWADWLGVGIGILRAGPGAAATGDAFVDYVNRCPEVSSTIDKNDREYASWAFDVALEVLAEAGVVANAVLDAGGVTALGPAMLRAWMPAE